MTLPHQRSEHLPDDLENIQSHQNQTDDIMKSLEELLDSMRKNNSYISKIADSWGKFPLWIKIGGALAVFGSLLLIGILALNTALIVTTCLCTLLYTLVSVGLDNHHATNKDEHDKLKSKILSLGGFLSQIVEKLNSTSLKLSAEVDRLSDLAEKTKIDSETTKINFEIEVSKLKVEVDTSRQHNEVLGRMIKSITSHFTENQESNTAFKDNLDRHLNEILDGKESFFQALGNIVSLEMDLKTSLQRNEDLLKRNEELLKRYDELVTIYQQKLDRDDRKTCSIGVQTDDFLHAEHLLGGIITINRDVVSSQSLVSGSQQAFRF